MAHAAVYLVSVAIGFLGALVGMFVANELGLPRVLSVAIDGHPFPLFWSIIGGALLVALVNLFSRRTMWGRWRYH